MEPFTSLDAVAVPLDRPNVDTDQLTPARFLSTTLRQRQPGDMGRILLHDLRYDADGQPRPDFVLNRGEYDLSLIHI